MNPGGVTVLVVEDDADLRYLFRISLTVAGYRVREAADGYQALVAIEQHSPAVVVLDLGLPHVTGFSVLEELAARSDPYKPVVVVVTGLDDAQCDDTILLRKPVEPPALVAGVRNALRRSAHGLQA